MDLIHIPTFHDYSREPNPFILEKSMSQKYDYGCVMAAVGIGNSVWKKIGSLIAKEDVYNNSANEYGLEIYPHVTILYGLHADIPDADILTRVKAIKGPLKLDAIKVSCFYNDKYDVLKFDIQSKDLGHLNKEFSKFPHTTSFPNYHPHLTIAYLKPGTGKKYDGNPDFGKLPINFTSDEILYSKANGQKIRTKI